ncbi:Inner membrane amino-acid ABC transporter permease protein YecS [Sporotomaculum syntrophicum]|uniref:Inner membrane amino-acid ABC transporter permease protein YecS n=1 Tax=Sporotomaculum syntrophicum TaxID=182264 RepID=A0A9D3AXT1_9FIRM|nr:amino acid ABC transporter permease [Sporotomaculum syntrophicum]KAF1084776.1 Inner membrane amino-acid ABC transporter permease protein YecS [Sporotomaculum syntrophicum]
MTNLDFTTLLPYINLLPAAIAITLQVGLGGFILAIVLAIVVGSLRTRKLNWAVHLVLTAYVEFFRGTPLLVQLFVVYYGLPSFGIRIEPMIAAIVTMGLNSGAYLSEVVRASILSVDRGQYEAAAMLGYNSLQTISQIILPQALRIAVPTFMNGFSSIIKETSLISVLPVVELTKLGNQIYAKTYHPFEIYITMAIIYFVMTYSVTFLAKWLERRLSVWVN